MFDEKSLQDHGIPPGSPTVAPASSSSSDNIRELNQTGTHLTVPATRLSRRPSIESAFSGSDISELSFGSTDFGSIHDEGLVSTLGNTSSRFANLPGPKTWRTKLQDFWVANYGAFLVLLSQIFGCTMNIATRLLETPGHHGEPMHPFQILFARQSITVLITTTYALWSKSVPHFPLGPPGKVRLLLISRGLFGFLGVFGLYFSLIYLPISEATILTFLAPIGSCYAFSLLIPGETFSKKQQIAGFISLIGVVFIARPVSLFSGGSPDSISAPPPDLPVANNTIPEIEGPTHPTTVQHLSAVGIAMIGVIGGIGAMTSIRAIGTRAHALLSVNYFSAWCTFVSLVALLFVPSVKFRLPGNSTEWGLLSILGFAGFIMQLLLTEGMAYGGPSSSEKQSRSNTDDLEMQARIVEPQASAAVGTQPAPSRAERGKPPPTKRIKGSGAKATSMMYTQMLFALVSDKVIFGITPGAWSWLGSSLILFGAIWVAADGTKGATVAHPVAPRSRNNTGASNKSVGTVSHEEQVGLLAEHDHGHDIDVAETSQCGFGDDGLLQERVTT